MGPHVNHGAKSTMQITIDTSTASQPELAAIATLFATLGGVIAPQDRPDAGVPAPAMPAFTAGPAPAPASVPAAPSSLSPAPVDSVPAAAPLPGVPAVPSKDSRGLPWDERIHSQNKTTNADGTWRRRSKIDDDTVARVEAELRGEPLPVVSPTLPPLPTAPVVMPPVPPVPSASDLVALMSAPAAAEPLNFATLSAKLGPAFAAGRVAEINGVLASMGVPNYMALGQVGPEGLAAAEGALRGAGLL